MSNLREGGGEVSMMVTRIDDGARRNQVEALLGGAGSDDERICVR
jgi:hypothetical protein